MPLTLRDVIWIQADERLGELEALETKKYEMRMVRERWEVLLTIVSDLRHIQLSKMYFTTDTAFKDFLKTLPSFKSNGQDGKEENRAQWIVKKRKPGELPEWKKKQMAELSAKNDKKTG